MFAATLATSGVTAVAGSPLGATRARRSPAVTSPVRLASPRRATSVRRRLELGAMATASDRKPREVKARAQVTTEEVTVTEVSGSVAAPMPEDDSVKVRTNAHHATPRGDDPLEMTRGTRDVVVALFSRRLLNDVVADPPPSLQTKHETQAKLLRFVDDNSIELNALMNVIIVGSVSFGTVFQVIEVDADIRTGWTWWEILRNIPADNLAAYQQSVFDNPVPTKACTSGVAYTLGDFTCQLSQGKTIATVDLRRSLRSGIAGFLIHGPLCHYWLLWTEQNLSFNNEWWTTPLKVFADQTAWSLFLNSAYTTCIMSLQGMSPARVKDEIQATWWNAISAGWKFWPFVHMLTFSPIIPQDFKLLWVDCVEVIWVTILSAAVNRDAEKALQVPLNAEAERPGLQMQEQLENEFSAEVSGVEMRFDKEFLPSRDSMDGESGASGDDGDGCAWSDTCAADFGGESDAATETAARAR
jgi:protein Mpv17